MEKITYLLGAGASAQALPLIKNNSNPDRLGLPQELQVFTSTHVKQILAENRDWDNRDIEAINEIANKCIEFGTPDLYAKFLLEIGDEHSYRLLKSLMSAYFKYKQEIQMCFDFRALTFLTTICSNKRTPHNINILSWNYDLQIELAAARLKNVKSKSEADYIRGFSSWPNVSTNYEPTEKPFLLHLNGIAGFTYSDDTFWESVEKHFDFTSHMDKELLLSFAWEDEEGGMKRRFTEKRLDMARKVAIGTNILVVIGYSFPFFNRIIDKEIMLSMMTSLQKIYFQDPFLDGSQLGDLFDLPLSLSSKIVHISQTENYHIPYEL